MQLQKITLENIGCFTHLNLALDRRLLLVYGLGKTTVLKALETSLKPFNGIKPVPYFYLNGIAKCIIRDKNIIYENGVISLFYSIKNDLSSHSINIKSNSLVFEFPNDLEGDKIFLLFFKDNLVSINNRYNAPIYKAFKKYGIDSFSLYILKTFDNYITSDIKKQLDILEK